MLLPFFSTNENIRNSLIYVSTIRLNKIQNLIIKKISKTTMLLHFHHMKRRRHLEYLRSIHRHNSFSPLLHTFQFKQPRFPLPYAQFQPLRHLLQLRNNHLSRLPRRESRFSLVMHISKKEKTTFSKLA